MDYGHTIAMSDMNTMSRLCGCLDQRSMVSPLHWLVSWLIALNKSDIDSLNHLDIHIHDIHILDIKTHT